MKKFIILLLKFSIPFVVAIAIYVVLDPFKVIWHYNSYYQNNKPDVIINKGYASTANFINKYPDNKYNSFIFGSSRSIVYKIADWQAHVPQPMQAYHFDAAGEGLYGITKKLEYIDSKNIPITNTLLFLDQGLLSQSEPIDGHLFSTNPLLDNNCSGLSFQFSYLRAFVSFKFIFYYIYFKCTGTLKPYMTELFYVPVNYNAVNNEMSNEVFENQIANGTYYTNQRMQAFYKRNTVQRYYKQCIKKPQEQLLSKIAAILKKHGTNYKIVINPLYDQKKLSNADLQYLMHVFGKENVFDFSGINKLTNTYTNYYEAVHYRPNVARAILDSVYSTK